jgi:hypothetical protein
MAPHKRQHQTLVVSPQARLVGAPLARNPLNFWVFLPVANCHHASDRATPPGWETYRRLGDKVTKIN